MYSEVFPYFRKFIKEVNSEFDFDFVPKDYWLESTPFQEALILENMKMKGYKLHNRQKPWNLKHSLKAMTTYGKFHALSFAIKDQKPEVFKHLTKSVQNSGKYINFEYLNQSFGSHLRNVLKLLKSANRNDLAIKFEEKFESIIYTPLEENDKFVIGHGDCWNNNFVFKYRNGDETSPSKVILLDFQMSTWETPVYDLAFIIYMTSDKSSLGRLDLLLETYYESLSKSLRILGSNPDEIFTFEQLKQHWKKYSAFGLRLSSKLLKMELMNDGDVPDLEKMVEENVPFEDWFNIKSEALEEYNRRILNVFIHYGENFL
ncbi:hypothetical protein HHI36_012467 [Cryptolaemus montrouzieri]|uniref:CHK kinase-like domain-containing protein n=1 Tax=Cryptolaemus montrouzieri TaxID=559131 RepID=A0ABD2NET8_9CUCU